MSVVRSPYHQQVLWGAPTSSGVLLGTRTPSIRVSSSSRRKVPQAGGYSRSDSLRTCKSHGREGGEGTPVTRTASWEVTAPELHPS